MQSGPAGQLDLSRISGPEISQSGPEKYSFLLPVAHHELVHSESSWLFSLLSGVLHLPLRQPEDWPGSATVGLMGGPGPGAHRDILTRRALFPNLKFPTAWTPSDAVADSKHELCPIAEPPSRARSESGPDHRVRSSMISEVGPRQNH